jgi:hypothetical protein
MQARAAFIALLLPITISAASFTLSSNSTTAQTLGSGSGQTGIINALISLTVSGATNAVTISGNSATLTNLGTISQTGTGRAVRDNTGSITAAPPTPPPSCRPPTTTSFK